MPRQFFPRKSGAHRIACIALYRGLLTQCSRITLPADLPSQGAIHPIKHFIRKQFRRHVHVTSSHVIVPALKAGYAALELLRSGGDGDEAATSQINTLLWQLHHEREAARAVCQCPTPRPPKPRVSPYPNALKVLESRPLPVERLTGRRTVPTLTVANGVPFLRFKRPQNHFLGRVLRNKMDQKQKRHETLDDMEEMFDLAMQENKFQKLVREEVENEVERNRKVQGKGKGKGQSMLEWLDGDGKVYWEDWTRDLWRVKGEAFERIIKEQKRWVEKAGKMAEIVEAERKLWMEERVKRKDEKWRAKLAKKRERKNGS